MNEPDKSPLYQQVNWLSEPRLSPPECARVLVEERVPVRTEDTLLMRGVMSIETSSPSLAAPEGLLGARPDVPRTGS